MNSKHTRNRRRKNKHSRKRHLGGTRAALNRQLAELSSYFTRYNRTPEKDEEKAEELMALSPYAKINHVFLYQWVIHTLINNYYKIDNNLKKRILNRVIDKTIAENDVTLFNKGDVVLCVIELISSYKNTYTDEINKLLMAIPPITEFNELTIIYTRVFMNLNVSLLETLQQFGHIPATLDDYNFILQRFHNIIGSSYRNPTPEEAMLIEQCTNIMENMRSLIEPERNALRNLIYSAQSRNINLPPDAIEEIGDYL